MGRKNKGSKVRRCALGRSLGVSLVKDKRGSAKQNVSVLVVCGSQKRVGPESRGHFKEMGVSLSDAKSTGWARNRLLRSKHGVGSEAHKPSSSHRREGRGGRRGTRRTENLSEVD